MNVEPTAKIIDDMASILNRYAEKLRYDASRMRETGSFVYASEVLNDITNCFNNLRTDLMVTRPIREYERAIVLNSVDTSKQA